MSENSFSFEPIEGFTVPISNKSKDIEVYSVVVKSAYLITDIGIEWANSEFVIHRNPGQEKWRISHRETGGAIGVFSEDYSILGAIDKVSRELERLGEEKYRQSIKSFKKMMDHAALGETEEYLKMASKRDSQHYGG